MRELPCDDSPASLLLHVMAAFDPGGHPSSASSAVQLEPLLTPNHFPLCLTGTSAAPVSPPPPQKVTPLKAGPVSCSSTHP